MFVDTKAVSPSIHAVPSENVSIDTNRVGELVCISVSCQE